MAIDQWQVASENNGGLFRCDTDHWHLHESADIEPLRELWMRAAAAPSASVFQQFELAREWTQVYATGPDAPFRLHIFYHDDPPVIAPFALNGDYLRMLGDGMFDYLDFIGEPPAGTDDGLMEHLAELEGWESLTLRGFREDSAFASYWKQPKLCVEWQPFKAAPLCRDNVSSVEFDRQHPKAADRWKTALRRGAQVLKVEDPQQRLELLDWMLLKKAERMAALGIPNVLGSREQQWLVRMVGNYPAICQLWALVRNGVRMAGFLTWAHAQTDYGYTLSFEPEFARESPGVTLLYAVLRRTIEQGREFDFLTGEQGFKLRFATAERRLFNLRGSKYQVASSKLGKRVEQNAA